MISFPCLLLGVIFLPMCLVSHAKTSSGSGVAVGNLQQGLAKVSSSSEEPDSLKNSASGYIGSLTSLTTSGGQGSWEDISQGDNQKSNSVSFDGTGTVDDNANKIPGLPKSNASSSYALANEDERRLLRDNPGLANQVKPSSRSTGITSSSGIVGDSDRFNTVQVQQDDQGLETMICPTVTQTLYLRPKTSTRTVHFIRHTASTAQANNYDYVTVGSPSQADRDGATASLPGSGLSDSSIKGGGPPLVPARTSACPRPTTEFRSFVYVSTVFVPTTLTDYTTITRTVSIPVENTYQQEPVTRYKTIFVDEVQPSMHKHRRPLSVARYPDSQQLGVDTVFATVTVTQIQPQDCPEVACGSGSQPARNYVLNDDVQPNFGRNTETLDSYMHRTAPNPNKQSVEQTEYLEQNGYVVAKPSQTVYALPPGSQIRPTPVKRCRPVIKQPVPVKVAQLRSSVNRKTYEDDYTNLSSASTNEEVILERYKRTLRDNHNRAYGTTWSSVFLKEVFDRCLLSSERRWDTAGSQRSITSTGEIC
ncbi:hypothetical protein RvY_16578-2 [Ramazzottius varieornatus]|uniref:Uncharacterized protein n=1 Tax=Ramazzottius varieornatus TaxID=947166 RepID=A0A1D1VZR6_RAMVA|nr:hypothetical protein RvY_16578-2 [Ramazzottius varieornatus]